MQNFIDNIPLFSVSEISQAIKHNLEQSFGYVKIKGEISGLKIHSSGHIYFNLKDQNGVINAVCFRNAAKNLKLSLDDGLEVILFGQITTYGLRSTYQIIVSNITLAGVGSLMALLEKKKKEFRAKGYFADTHKKPIPKFPQKIAVVTSETGAVIEDIKHRIADRYPLNLIIAPARVQGVGAEIEIAEQINHINNLQHKPDIIIVARGGGSIEDLWCFNEDIVIEAVFNSHIPVISAIGHETDTTLIDLVADLRAPTPTAAAELATPELKKLKLELEKLTQKLNESIYLKIDKNIKVLEQIERFLRSPENIIMNKIQHIDELSYKIENIINNKLNNYQHKLKFITEKLNLKSLTSDFKNKIDKINFITKMLDKNLNNKLDYFGNKIVNLDKLINSLSYKNILKRGYSVVRIEEKIVSHADSIPASGEVKLEFYDSSKIIEIAKK